MRNASAMALCTGLLTLPLLAASTAPASAQLRPDEIALAQMIETALVEGEITATKQLSSDVGINRPYRLSLNHEGFELACLWKNPDRRVDGSPDHWRFEIAAYRLDRLLGLGMVPPTVERELEGERGSCQYWISNARTIYSISQESDARIPGDRAADWQRWLWLREAFDNLIGNADRNQGNCLVSEDWRLVLTDHSRAFPTGRMYTVRLQYEGPEVHRLLPRSFVERVRALTRESVADAVGDTLSRKEIRALLKRRDLFLKVTDRRIAELGEPQVLY